ncbi:MAG TPA: hypothetical protein VGO67_25240 [Verrucomicrobiae bacterium]|jgi:hypothetical protein
MAKENSTRGVSESTDATLASAQAENAALKARIAEMESAKSQNEADETLIVAKMTKGLRREQARAVILRQREYDKRRIKN